MTGRVPREAFDQVIKATGEWLQSLGFTPRAAVLRIQAQGNCGIIEFQRSVKSSRDKILFTVNVGIVCGDILDSEAPLQDMQQARFVHAQIRQRIGAFLPGHPDKWWEVTSSTDADALARELLELLLKDAVPFIQRYLGTDSIISLWESGQSPGLTDGQRADLLATLKAKRQGGGT